MLDPMAEYSRPAALFQDGVQRLVIDLHARMNQGNPDQG